MIKAGIIGSTGYAGAELARLLYQHPEAEVVWYGSRSYVDKKFSSVFGNVFQIVLIGTSYLYILLRHICTSIIIFIAAYSPIFYVIYCIIP